jgi:hypothetical protein
MMHALRAVLTGALATLLFLPAALAGQSGPVLPQAESGERGSLYDAPASQASRALAPSASPLLFVPGQGLLAAPEILAEDTVPPPVAVQPEDDRRTNLSLIAAGATLLVAGSFIDGSAGTVVMVGGALFSAVGVYRWVR